MKKLFIANFIVVGLFLGAGISFAADGWEPTGPTAEDILSDTKVENLAIKGSREEKLINAVKNGDLKNVETLIAEGAALEARDAEDMTALMIAAKKGHADITSKLINAGANVYAVDKFGWTSLFIATDKGHTDTVRILMAAGAASGERDFDSIFVSAVFKGNTEMVKALIVKDANIDCNALETAYMIALNQRKPELVNILNDLKSQCNVD